MSLLERFIENANCKNLFHSKDRIIVAVSGGIDSVVLCELCKQSGFEFEIVHCNFQLRGEESERDENFVKELAEKYTAPFFIKKFDTKKYSDEKKVSIQVAARELRYQWFEELLVKTSDGKNNHQSRYLLTAHHANDAIETLLINFFKGTGMKGLKSIPEKNGKIRRPLLFAKKNEIISFAKDNNLKFVEDSSNLSDKYTRNFLRNQLIPSLKKIFPEIEDNLLNNIERFKEAENLYEQSVELYKKKLMSYHENEIHIPVLKILKIESFKTILYEIIKQYHFTPHQTNDVVDLLKSDTGKLVASATHRIFRNRLWLVITPINNKESVNILIQEKDNEIEFENGRLSIKYFDNNNFKISPSKLAAALDAKDIQFPLLLRKWKTGDYFYPLGMPKKKKIGKFFNDQKMSIADKERIWLIESNKKIIWIINNRIDDRFKITNNTKKIFQVSFRER